MALAGADVLIYPTAIGWESTDTDEEKARQREAWIISQRAHAVANGLHVISVNRTGYEADPSGVTNGIQFWGSSFVAGPQGEFLAQHDGRGRLGLAPILCQRRADPGRRDLRRCHQRPQSGCACTKSLA